jgi:ATP-dependent 26S proteasome regulatory subunit
MDGLTTEDGVIVVATANDPTSLSNALLKRPGRFDRVARFSTPSVDLRRRYLTHMSGGNFDEAEATAAALALDRFSFAQIREAYILAGQFAFNCGSEITANDMARAAKQLRQEGQRINRHTENGGVGFSIVDDQVSVS